MTAEQRRIDGMVKRPSPARFVLVALTVPVLLLALFGWMRHEYFRSEAVRAQLARSFDRRIAQIELLSHLKDAETAQRGYLLTGDPAFLAPYEPARRAVTAQLARDAAAADPEVPEHYLGEVRTLAGAKFAELDETIRLARRDRAGAIAIVADGRGRRTMDRLRAVIGARIGAEAARVEERRAVFLAWRETLQRIILLLIGAMAALLTAVLFWVWQLRRARYGSLVAAFESAERNETVLDSTIDALLILNPSGTVESTNAAATRMLGYSSAELERRDVGTVMDIAPGMGSFHQRVGLIDGQLRQSFLPDTRVRHRDGREIAVDVAIGEMNLPSGLHLVVSLRDISERKRLDRVKDELMSTVSHELRTPLTSVIGALGLLRAGAAGAIPPAAARLVDIAENNSRRLIRLINDMLDIDRIESGKLEIARAPVDLRSVIDDACVSTEGLVRPRDVRLACRNPADPVMVAGDADRLVQVVTNLLSNAARVAPAGSAIEVGVEADATVARIAVEDRGPGIPANFRDRIFGRFERADPDDGATGTGLGLAISREIVLRHNGAIWFEDREGGGTRFVFTVPLLASTASAAPEAEAVLICEEDDDTASALIAIVADEGCSYDLVRSADAARAALARRRYTALLVGMTLPEEGGIAFAHAARAGDPPVDVPIIVVARSVEGDGPAVLDVVDWLDKPADPTRLSIAIRAALARGGARPPLILHLDDDRDLLAVVGAAIEPEARIVAVTSVAEARAALQRQSPDLAILDIMLAEGSGLDLIPFLVDEAGVAIPTIIYSAQDVSSDLARRVDAVLIKARGSIPDLKATIRRVLRMRGEAP